MGLSAPEQAYGELRAVSETNLEGLKGKPLIRIGTATCGRAAGAVQVRETFKEELNRLGIDARVIDVGCLGHCYAEPLVMISKPGFTTLCYGNVDVALVKRLAEDVFIHNDPCYEFALAALESNDLFPAFTDFPRGVYEEKMILRSCGFIDPEEIDYYIAEGGYSALVGALEMRPEAVLEEIKAADLRGRGGAGFPAGLKWEAAAKAPGEMKYIICNGDEGDPGAFMDRNILESNPHQVIEGMIICAYSVGAASGYLYIRSEYPRALDIVKKALVQAREKSLLGDSILGSGFLFDLEVFPAPGGFVCGEGTALIDSMEGGMGIPRHRPPEVTLSGYLGKPTVLNNVKTFCYVPLIMQHGAEWFRGTGSAGNPGTAVIALAGKIAAPGLVEVPMGTTLRQLIYDVGGGLSLQKNFKAVQIGGPSGGCLPEGALDLPLDFETLQKAGAMMGSGGIVVLDEDDCIVRMTRYFLEFTQRESCGKCTFCRLGTRHMLEILQAITRGEGDLQSLATLRELAEDVKAGSLCNLGKTAPGPVLTSLDYFYHEFEAHILEKRCPSLSCPDLIEYYIAPEKCSKLCNVCVGSCPTEAVYTREDGLKAIDRDKCVKCNNCLKACPVDYAAVAKKDKSFLIRNF